MQQLAALIFDVDGTLAETEELHRAAFNAAFAQAGLAWHWDQTLYAELLAVTGGKERIAAYISATSRATRLTPQKIAALHAAKTKLFAAAMVDGGMELRPGVRRLVMEAHEAGLRLAIATTTTRANVDALLNACAPLPVFEVICAGDDVPAKKPAPDVYVLALERLGLPAARCLAVEDTPNGLHSAQGAGLRCIITTSAYGGTQGFAQAAAVISHLGESAAPCTSLAGPVPPGGVVDVPYLRALIEA